jgi:hypothetical protein
VVLVVFVVLVPVVLVVVEVEVFVVVVETGLPVLVRYLMPEDGQEPASGALMGTKVPSTTLPLRL